MILYSALYDENILHFIGQWHLATEHARHKHELEAFRRLQEDKDDPDDVLALSQHPRQVFSIPDYIPYIPYLPSQWHPGGSAHFALPGTVGSDPSRFHELIGSIHAERPHFGSHGGHLRIHREGPDLPAPGQVIFIVSQATALQDNDILNLGSGPAPELDPTIGARLLDLFARAGQADALSSLSMPHGPEDLASIVVAAQDIIAGGDLPNLVAQSHHLTGIYVNGAQVDGPVLLNDVLPPAFLPEPESEPVEATQIAQQLQEHGIEGSLTLQAGANMAMNTAVLSNVGLLGGVIAVAGDVYRLDAIIQSNAYSDIDTVTGQMQAGAGGASASYNVAQFIDQPMEYARVVSDAENMPRNWAVSVVDGDLIFSQWVVQTNFIYDNDIHVLTDTGAYSNFITGANLAHNITSFSDLGLVYDLILIGGNLYDANIITQLNVLLDNDFLSLGNSGGEGTLSTGGNLLYNGATISNLGAQNWLEGLPQHYLEALQGLAAGNGVMPDGFAADGSFAGIDMLNVLVVTGNVYDLHYIKQTNVVGDVDQVATAEAATLAAGAPSRQDWDISTGQNALINTATILDTDSLGNVAYAGGHVYSDAILIQADFIASASDGPDALVTEAIAFLTDDHGMDITTADDGITATPADIHGADVMSSILT